MALANLPDGWLTAPEADQLRVLADGLIVLEMGAWKGRSTVVMAETAGLVISVDRHLGISGHGESLDDYLAAVGHLLNVVKVIGAFDDVVPHLASIDMVYIDGDHDYDSVKRDILLAATLKPGMVAFHDWDFDEVREAGTEQFGTPDGVVGSVAWYRA